LPKIFRPATLPELVTWTTANPGKINFSSNQTRGECPGVLFENLTWAKSCSSFLDRGAGARP